MQTQLHGLLHQAGVVDARDDGHAASLAVLHYARVEPRAHDEVYAGLDGLIDLGRGQHGTSTDDHLRKGFPQAADRLGGSRSAEGDLCAGHAVVHQGLAESDGIIGVLDGDDGDDLQGGELFKQYRHGKPRWLSGQE